MNEIQDIYLQHSFLGYRRITALLRRDTIINKKRVLRLMRKMGLQAIYPKKKLSQRGSGSKIYPYLLKESPPKQANDTWCVDITYIRVVGSYAYLTALIDCTSRKIMGWFLSPFLDAQSCLEALDQGLRQANPKIVNSDQGSQFTSKEWTEMLENSGIKISMDGKGRYLDNILIERFWRSIKYEEVYLKSYASMTEARKEIGRYVEFYNYIRPHQSLDYQTPDEVHQKSLSKGDEITGSPLEGVPPQGGLYAS